ncbi:hypothetical protein, partial [Paraburkholderia sp. RL17-373-BIF-A]|uniref:hypothetical protein n=1 Tax=Paraburkholderia sp. RL17-373-BIF-A TaxID=3031629 RepID=UPI0038BC5EF4
KIGEGDIIRGEDMMLHLIPFFTGRKINEVISKNIEPLNMGFDSSMGVRVFLHDGRDMVTYERFGEDVDAEWCLLRRDNGIYDVVTEGTANALLVLGTQPLTRAKIGEADVVRGAAMLSYFA